MPPVTHSKKYSPSKSSIWTRCALSTLLNQGDETYGDAAIFGTQCHELGQRLIEKALNITNYDEESKDIEEPKLRTTWTCRTRQVASTL